MPRVSIANRAAAAFRAAVERPKPPRGMPKAAAKLWREIVDDRPPDWFRPGSYELLETFCCHVVELRRLRNLIETAEFGSDEYYDALSGSVKLSGSIAALATKMRISVQSNVEWQSRKLAEHGVPRRDPLLGGMTIGTTERASKH